MEPFSTFLNIYALSNDPAHNSPASNLFFKMHLNVITLFNAQFISPVHIFLHNFVFIPVISHLYLVINRDIFLRKIFPHNSVEQS